MSFFTTIWEQMFIGNFSFAIFIVGIIQTILMSITLIITINNRRR